MEERDTTSRDRVMDAFEAMDNALSTVAGLTPEERVQAIQQLQAYYPRVAQRLPGGVLGARVLPGQKS